MLSAPDDIVVTGAAVLAPAPGDPPGGWFDADAELGPRGHKYLPRGACYLLAAGRRALRSAGALECVPPERRGLAVATNNALAPLFGTMDDTVVHSDAGRLSPALAPYFAVNVVAARLAAEQSLKAFNLTVTTPAVAGVEALQHAMRALRLGRADLVLVAAVEDHLAPGTPGEGESEEGAVALVLESRPAALRRGAPAQGTLRAATTFLPPTAGRATPAPDAPGPDDAPGALRHALADLLAAVDAHPPAPLHLVLDSSPRARATAARLPAAAGTAAAGAGCLRPLLDAAQPLTARTGTGRLVLAATAHGHLAAVHTHSTPPPGGHRAQPPA
ncbi:beta-ketoacyl synthase N-terminal-like domain-containing protein [Kitasatospora sp. NPDC056327]|uniref:beta-ketoacyl synthase N-terminal-like domain-containing protein n=1 Tax=Kitasatospora sp. NPDC056327 TaxID=3345785 RepID=UPI0035D7E071